MLLGSRADIFLTMLCDNRLKFWRLQSDSDGPMVCFDEEDAQWFFTGVISTGYGCARAGFQGIYTQRVNSVDRSLHHCRLRYPISLRLYVQLTDWRRFHFEFKSLTPACLIGPGWKKKSHILWELHIVISTVWETEAQYWCMAFWGLSWPDWEEIPALSLVATAEERFSNTVIKREKINGFYNIFCAVFSLFSKKMLYKLWYKFMGKPSNLVFLFSHEITPTHPRFCAAGVARPGGLKNTDVYLTY